MVAQKMKTRLVDGVWHLFDTVGHPASTCGDAQRGKSADFDLVVTAFGSEPDECQKCAAMFHEKQP